MKQFLQLILTVLFSSMLFSCKKDYPPRVVMQENQRSKEEKESLQPNEMLENEGLRFNIDYPDGSAKLVFRLYKASPNRSEVRLRVIEESREYFVLSKHMDNNTDFIVTVEPANVSTSANFQLAVTGILSLKGPAGLQMPRINYSPQSTGVEVEFLKIRKGNLKFSFFPL